MLIINTLSSGQVLKFSSFGFDTTRIFNVMAKARRGENITIGVLGGSITQGYAASSEANRWANLMTDWWKATFPKSKVTLVNAGFGGTGSDIGAFRVKTDLLKFKPDFVVVEFSVNDVEGIFCSQTMEGLLRQILNDKNYPGVMMLILKEVSGKTALKSHKPVAEYYKIPVVSFAELIDSQVIKDNIKLASLFLTDGLHPVDSGMKYIAKLIIDELNRIYINLPPVTRIKEINSALPTPKFSEVYAHTYKYDNTNLAPLFNKGWQKDATGWFSDKVDSELTFSVDGNIIAILYSRFKEAKRGKAEVWVDNGQHKIFDAYFSENWGPATVFGLVADNLDDGVHTLHVRIINEQSNGSTGHYFQLLNILKAGHFKDETSNADPLKKDFKK